MASSREQRDNKEDRNPLRPKIIKPTPHSGPSATIALAQGQYTGVLLPPSPLGLPRAVEAWRGIPYAQTTGGSNRFRPPVPLDYGPDRRFSAASFGRACPAAAAAAAAAVPPADAGDAEDCLNLNVYRPAPYSPARDGALPVVIYVHGGAFNAGLGTERDMASFVGWSEAPILGVNFNYRVGALGFPSSGAAQAEGALNLGLRDQRFLFEWVRDNIGEFGGDRERVTLMGVSAGAHSIGYHLQSYTTTDHAPFHRAIMESGGATARATLSPTHPRTESQFREFLAACGIQPDHIPADQTFPLLRSLPLATILSASGSVFARYQDPIRWPFQPVVERARDGDAIIRDLPIRALRRGDHAKVPVLAGFNTNEGTVFTSPAVETDDDFLRKFTAMIPGLTAADLRRLSALYPDPVADPSSPYARVPPGYGRQWARYEAAYAHYAYVCPVLQTGHFYSGGSGDNNGEDEDKDPPPVWIYHFAALARPDLGGKANHCDEAAVVAHDMAAIGPHPGLVRIADAMHGAWARFVATGDPNPAHIDDGVQRAATAITTTTTTTPTTPTPTPTTPTTTTTTTPTPATPTSTTTTSMPFWPRFTSPLVGDTETSPGRYLRRRDGDGAEASGRVMMFGLGNDERLGGAGRGTPGLPATVVRLTDGEVERCRFWWERVELSEGMGRRLSGGGGGAVKARL
ncbi:hypothetical protein SLS53_002078 [Cytospora paraplurivora]|uniref:Carboxylic ester hydrolase n=1 Tax=Cytospora paraplurivora TaxID=2898453 RepID=A0AAN9UI48_9PEZI